jgi:hypothetical protein
MRPPPKAVAELVRVLTDHPLRSGIVSVSMTQQVNEFAAFVHGNATVEVRCSFQKNNKACKTCGHEKYDFTQIVATWRHGRFEGARFGAGYPSQVTLAEAKRRLARWAAS